ncbi:MAG TPA: transporter [Burkholderiaceae bacterium]|nr:transporter [Burkholderiaceae bacterium]
MNKNTLLAIAALVACGSAAATEDYDLRYAPGYGGADMSAPFEGGWVFQAHAYYYSANVRGSSTVSTDLTPALSAALNTTLPSNSAGAVTTIRTNDQQTVYGLLPRLSYMSATTFLGATLGGTVLLPLIDKGSVAGVTSVNTTLNGLAATLPAANQAALIGLVNASATAQGDALATANSNKTWGTGDLEFSPILRWSTEATQTLFILTTVAPTGDYNKNRAANPSAGKFWTFRPAVQFSYIGDGWDAGTRLAYSYNTRNVETKYKSGSYLNLDLALMKSISESTRVGLSGYAVDQLTRDDSKLIADTAAGTYANYAATFGTANAAVAEAREAGTLDQKGRVFGLGPEVAYIHGAGDYLLEGRIMKEFGSQTRPKGFTAFVTLSKPF